MRSNVTFALPFRALSVFAVTLLALLLRR